MLNITDNSVAGKFDNNQFGALRRLDSRKSRRVLIKLLGILFGLSFAMMFAPWTQNIRSRGQLTTLMPDQKPQTIHSVIAGRIEKWYVREGEFVSKGDTILFISEVKVEYMDPNLLSRTEEQLRSKEMSVSSYMEKVKALDSQIDALVATSKLKRDQAENYVRQAQLKVTSDSMDYRAAVTNHDIARAQLERMEGLYEQGLKSKTELENRELKLQEATASMISAENKLLTSRNALINTRVEVTSIEAQYRDAIAKAESEKYTSLSNMYDAEAVVTKLQNQYMNYSVRSGLYFITAPQDGFVTKTIQSGIGELIKEGEPILSVMPANYDLAVEMYVRPIDLPLIQTGQVVRIQFDGWPAIVFSGWPGTSYGTYGGKVFAIDNFISDNGMYRVLVAPDPDEYPWPDALRVGAGSSSILLLNEVPVGYELWRKVNGFPPDYYSGESSQKQRK